MKFDDFLLPSTILGERMILPVAWRSSTKFSYISRRDLGEAYARILSGREQHFGAQYQLVGTTAGLNTQDIIATLEQTLDHEVRCNRFYVPWSPDGRYAFRIPDDFDPEEVCRQQKLTPQLLDPQQSTAQDHAERIWSHELQAYLTRPMALGGPEDDEAGWSQFIKEDIAQLFARFDSEMRAESPDAQELIAIEETGTNRFDFEEGAPGGLASAVATSIESTTAVHAASTRSQQTVEHRRTSRFQERFDINTSVTENITNRPIAKQLPNGDLDVQIRRDGKPDVRRVHPPQHKLWQIESSLSLSDIRPHSSRMEEAHSSKTGEPASSNSNDDEKTFEIMNPDGTRRICFIVDRSHMASPEIEGIQNSRRRASEAETLRRDAEKVRKNLEKMRKAAQTLKRDASRDRPVVDRHRVRSAPSLIDVSWGPISARHHEVMQSLTRGRQLLRRTSSRTRPATRAGPAALDIPQSLQEEGRLADVVGLAQPNASSDPSSPGTSPPILQRTIFTNGGGPTDPILTPSNTPVGVAPVTARSPIDPTLTPANTPVGLTPVTPRPRAATATSPPALRPAVLTNGGSPAYPIVTPANTPVGVTPVTIRPRAFTAASPVTLQPTVIANRGSPVTPVLTPANTPIELTPLALSPGVASSAADILELQVRFQSLNTAAGRHRPPVGSGPQPNESNSQENVTDERRAPEGEEENDNGGRAKEKRNDSVAVEATRHDSVPVAGSSTAPAMSSNAAGKRPMRDVAQGQTAVPRQRQDSDYVFGEDGGWSWMRSLPQMTESDAKAVKFLDEAGSVGNSNILQWLIGRQPEDLEMFLRRRHYELTGPVVSSQSARLELEGSAIESEDENENENESEDSR
ncbi:hypothetical protein AC579_9606 [Pseudocercospora musae]|uniref:Uncharacterized protein n=1 Tax=Pseudocercospora musae TaxID=113226 RepID=A0A139ITN1_9PEZI|nr:hypothetical protein AC579_9606 [Pseudocercospora musae]